MSITAKSDIDDAIAEARAQALEFNWDENDDADFRAWVTKAQTRVAVRVRQRVGAGNYAATGTTSDEITEAEQMMLVAEILKRRLVILSSRPEEAPPPEYIDLDVLQRIIEDYNEQGSDLLGPHATEEGDKAGTAWSFSATGVDETEADASDGDYDETDFGTLPS